MLKFAIILTIEFLTCSTIGHVSIKPSLWEKDNAICKSELPPIVNVAQGILKGSFGVSRDGKRFYQFMGVQYAHIPSRFEMAIPPSPWNGTKLATQFGPSCSERARVIVKAEDEDCLSLNVFTPKLWKANAELFPVLMYIHGGSFQWNSNQDFGPNYMMDEDVVFVVINYRLGPLGFLSTGDIHGPGNYGLKDQVMAMKWIRENIQTFNGDPARLTIMGQSAGSASVTYHLISPMSRGLFQNAIVQSGNFLDPWAFTRNPLPAAEKLGQLLNCSTSSTKILMDCLKSVDVTKITDPSIRRKAMVKWHKDPLGGFGPVIEPFMGQQTTFLRKSPYVHLMEGDVAHVPLLTGVTKEEGIYLWAAYILYGDNPQCLLDLQTNWTGVAPTGFYFDEVVEKNRRDEVSLKIRDFYFGSKNISKDTFVNLSHLYSDRLFINSAVNFINLYSKKSSAPVFPYLYTFNKYMGLEFNWIVDGQQIEATHGAELDMLISPLFNRTRNNPDHNELSRKIVRLWTSFISKGTPSATYGSATQFPPINPEEGLKHWYELDTDSRLQNNIFKERNEFWEGLSLLDNDFTRRPKEVTSH